MLKLASHATHRPWRPILHGFASFPKPCKAEIPLTRLGWHVNIPYQAKSLMAFRDFLTTQRQGMQEMATSGVIGLHLVSGPLVGFAIGYALDLWLHTSPWCKLIFLFIGICAGFLNVWRDTRELLRKMEARQSRSRHTAPKEKNRDNA